MSAELEPRDRSTESIAPPPLRSQNSLFHTVFLQPSGLRAGWRAALYAALFILIFYVVQVAGSFLGSRLVIPPGGQMTPGALLRQELSLAASAIAAALVMSALEGRPFGEYGMPWKNAFGRKFWEGVFWGLAQVTALVVSIWALGGFSFGGLALPGAELVRYAFVWGGFFVVVGIAEEFLFRGYVQFTLASGMGFWPAATLLSAIFGAVHLGNPGEGPVGALSVFAIGMLFCLTLRRTGNLWFAIGMHAAFDFGETYVYGVPDSGLVMRGHLFASSIHGPRWLTGGSIGPEGSALSFVVVALMFIVLSRAYPAPEKSALPDTATTPP